MHFPTIDMELNTARVLDIELSFLILAMTIKTARNARNMSLNVHIIKNMWGKTYGK